MLDTKNVLPLSKISFIPAAIFKKETDEDQAFATKKKPNKKLIFLSDFEQTDS